MAQNSINFSECIKKSHLIFFWDSPLLHFTTENVLWNSILKSSPVKNILDAKRWHVTKWFFMDDTRIKKRFKQIHHEPWNRHWNDVERMPSGRVKNSSNYISPPISKNILRTILSQFFFMFGHLLPALANMCTAP